MIINSLRSSRGVALVVVLAAITLMTFVALEVAYESQVNYVVSSQEINKLKARYAARAGAKLSLLRLNIYKTAQQKFGQYIKNDPQKINIIWELPFSWPPSGFLEGVEDKVSLILKDEIKNLEKEMSLDSNYSTIIESEEGRINLLNLTSPVRALRTSTRSQLMEIFDRERADNLDFDKKYLQRDIEALVNNIVDWMDEDSVSLNGGAENHFYKVKNDFLPPNQSFKTLDELHMVAGMDDHLFKLLEDRVTVYGSQGININFAGAEVLKSLSLEFTDELVSAIIERRNDPELGGPFRDINDLNGFVARYISRSDWNSFKVPILFSSPYNFRITSLGSKGGINHKIVLVTYDVIQNASEINKWLEKEKNPSPSKKKKKKPKKPASQAPQAEALRIVYWQES